MPAEAGRRAAREPRLASDGVVRLLCPGRRGVQSGFLRDVSRGGMFLHLVDPEPAGTRLGFELSLPGRRERVCGTGEVAWVREAYGGPGRPPGMAVRFLTLELPGARELTDLLGAPPRADVAIVEPTGRDGAVRAGATAGPTAAAARVPSPGAAEEGTAATAEPSVAPPAAALGEGWREGYVPPRAADPGAEHPVRGVRATGRAALLVAGSALLAVGLVWWSPWRHGAPPAPAEARAAAREAAVDGRAAPVRQAHPAEAAAGAALAPGGLDTTATAPGAAPVRGAGATPPDGGPASGGDRAPAAALAPASRLVAVRWQPAPAGGTLVVLELDGLLEPARLAASRIGGDSPRQLLELAGVRPREARPGRWEVGTAELVAVRTGYHPGEAGGELHVVLDLAADDVVVRALDSVGAELRCELARPQG